MTTRKTNSKLVRTIAARQVRGQGESTITGSVGCVEQHHSCAVSCAGSLVDALWGVCRVRIWYILRTLLLSRTLAMTATAWCALIVVESGTGL